MKTIRSTIALLAITIAMFLAPQNQTTAACLDKASTSYSGDIQGYTAGSWTTFPYSICTAAFASPSSSYTDVKRKTLYNDHDAPYALHSVINDEYNVTSTSFQISKLTCGEASYMMALVVLKDCFSNGMVSGCCGCVNYAKVTSWDLD